jgi:hypothetical protein
VGKDFWRLTPAEKPWKMESCFNDLNNAKGTLALLPTEVPQWAKRIVNPGRRSTLDQLDGQGLAQVVNALRKPTVFRTDQNN